MRRMYSKEQLQKLIDEVSRLIAIEELDKVVPVPSVAKAGYYMAVNSAGTGYELVPSPDSTHLFWHTVRFTRGSINPEAAEYNYSRLKGYMIILTNSATAITLSDFQNLLKILVTNLYFLNLNRL